MQYGVIIANDDIDGDNSGSECHLLRAMSYIFKCLGIRVNQFFSKYIERYILWCRGVAVKHADSQHRGCQFDSSMCHF